MSLRHAVAISALMWFGALGAHAQELSPEAAPADAAQEQTDESGEPAASGAAQDAPAGPAMPEAPPTQASADAVTEPIDPLARALKNKVAALPVSEDGQEAKEREAIAAFYAERMYRPLWMETGGEGPKAKSLIEGFSQAAAYGLNASDYAAPAREAIEDLEKLASTELTLTRAALLYARHARGGRIMKPAEMLNSNIDRKPQLIDPRKVLDSLADTQDAAAALAAFHPKHEQFELLRQEFLKAGGGKKDANGGTNVLSTAAKRIRANMEMWRWMYDDMGELYVFNNIPEFMQYVYKDGKVIRKEKIVVGMLDKQSSIFSRPLKNIALRPLWRVPESIMVHELWPSLLRGGGLMRQYGLIIKTKDGEGRDWRTIDWSKDDIRNYHVFQPPGSKSVLGVVKFTFPSQHTIFMHDTPDKWMFRSAQRTHSHGCLRVWKPVELAEIILDYDKGWDKDKVKDLIRSGPLNNEVAIDKRVMINLVYFTMRVEDDGKLRSFPDIYGHERRVIQALDGQWDKINKGRDHLAKPQPNFNPKAVAASGGASRKRAKQQQSTGDIIGDIFGGLTF